MIQKIKEKHGAAMRNAGPWLALILYLVAQATYSIWWASGITKDSIRHDSEIIKLQDERNGISKLTERIVKLEVQTEQGLDALQRIERRLDRPRRE